MNTLMWEHPYTRAHLRELESDFATGPRLADAPIEEIIDGINRTHTRLRIVPPQSKKLACGDVGVGGIAENADILIAVDEMLTRTIPPSGGRKPPVS